MADPVNQTLQDQLQAGLDKLAPQIRGLPDIAAAGVSAALAGALNDQLTVRVRRRDLIQAVLDTLTQAMADMTALEDDGWPADVPEAPLATLLFNELQGDKADIEAAVAVFQQQANITGGDPTLSPNPDPPTV